jgi:predicted SAM-dependent methyltransferase
MRRLYEQLKWWFRERTARRPKEIVRGGKLHVGAGSVVLPGWINVDNRAYPKIDYVLDVTAGLPFRDLDFVFAEHFIEHLPYDAALNFLRRCREALGPDGVIRLSTPNLDWVWRTQYHPDSWTSEAEKVRDCFGLNRGFRGWGHQFLYNFATLEATLREAGFGSVKQAEYGESAHAELRNLERHEKYPDSPELPHIIIVEASGRSEGPSGVLREPLESYRAVIEVV